MDEEIKRKTALVLEIIQDKTSVLGESTSARAGIATTMYEFSGSHLSRQRRQH